MFEKKEKKRMSNFELLRIIAIIIILISHFNFFSGLSGNFESVTVNSILTYSLRIGVVANYIFIILTGYFLVESKPNYKKIIKLLLEMFFYSILILLVLLIFNKNLINSQSIIKSLLPIFFGNWFLIYYILLFIFTPFLNEFVRNTSQKTLKTLIFIMISILVVLTFSKNLWNYNYHFFFIVAYFVGAYLKLYCKNSFKNNKKIIAVLVLSSLFTLISTIVLQYIGFKFNISYLVDKSDYFIRNSYSIFPFLIAISLVLLFRNIKINYCPIINRIATSVLGIYLIHENFLLRNIIWKSFLPITFNINSGFLPIYMIGKVLLVFSICLIVDQLRILLLGKIEENFSNKIYSLIRKKQVNINE